MSTAHVLLSQDDDTVSCLTCGALLGVDDHGTVYDGDGNPADGSWACSGDTSQRHGDPREHGDDENDPRYDGCTCLLCH